MPPEGPFLFPPDQLYQNRRDRALASPPEVTREQVFLQLHDELPDSATVEGPKSWQERPDGSVRVEQVIYVRRTSQRAIVLGEGGKRIKTIGARARAELGAMLDRKVHLFLFVKVRENWLDDPERFRAIGVDFNV